MKKILFVLLCLFYFIFTSINTTFANDKKVGIFYDERFLLHDTGPNHPENPERLIPVIRDLKNNDRITSNTVWPNFEVATVEELGLAHSKEYIELVDRQVSQLNNNRAYLSTGDTAISKHTNLVAKLAVGAGLEAVDQIMAGDLTSAFALVRPPGHHASSSIGMGFCVYNNIAVVSKYLQKKYGLERILIVDFDVHHGNGTQDIFYEDNSVFYFSVHQHPLFPGTGRPNEIGKGEGEGYTLNIELPKRSGNNEVIKAFNTKLKPAMDQFRPEFVLVSAGFDAHLGDPLGHLNYTGEGYGVIAEILKDISQKYADGRTLYMLEGGYNADNVSQSVQKILNVLISTNIDN